MSAAPIRPLQLWAIVSPNGHIWGWAIRRTRRATLKAWTKDLAHTDAERRRMWARDRARGWRCERVVVQGLQEWYAAHDNHRSET